MGILLMIVGGLFLLWVLFSDDTEWKKNVPNTVLVKEIILYTGFILHEKKIKHYPDFKIYYYQNKKYAGVYNGKIIIYLGSNPTVDDIVNTTLHEIQHHIQDKTDPQYKHYNKFTEKRGYWNNPFEKEARRFASKYEDKCIEYLASKNLIQKS
jgi:hypothetical protein